MSADFSISPLVNKATLPGDVAYIDVANGWTIAQNFPLGSTVASDAIATANNNIVFKNKDLTDPSNLISISNLPSDIAYVDRTNVWTVVQNFPNSLITIGTNLILTSSGLSAPRTFTFPDADGAVVTTSGTQTLTNKTLTNPALNGGTITLAGINTALFKTNLATTLSILQVVPSYPSVIGTRVGASLQAYNTNDTTTNTEYVQLVSNGVPGFFVDVEKTGTGVLRSLNLSIAAAPSLTVNTDGTMNFQSKLISNLSIANPANTFGYVHVGSAIVANRNVTFPLLTADDTFVFAAFANAFTGLNTFTGGAVVSTATWQFRNTMLLLTNPAVSKNYIVNTSAITADRNVTLPLLAADDTFVFAAFAQTLTNKTMSGASNTFTNIPKSALPASAVFTDQSNTFGDFGQIFPSTQLEIFNPAKTFGYSFVSSAIAADRNVTLPLLTANDTFVFAAFTQTLTNKTMSGASNTFVNIPKSALPATAVFTDQSNTFGAFGQIFPSGQLEVLNPAGTFGYSIVGSAIAADRNATLPLLTANDTFVFQNLSQTLTNKIMSGASNTFTNIPKSALPTTAVYTDQSNTFGDFGQIFPSTQLEILNPAKTFGYSFVSSAITADRNVTLPLITANDTFVLAAFAQTLTNKTISNPVIGENLTSPVNYFLLNPTSTPNQMQLQLITSYTTTPASAYTSNVRLNQTSSPNTEYIELAGHGSTDGYFLNVGGTVRVFKIQMAGVNLLTFKTDNSIDFNSRTVTNLIVTKSELPASTVFTDQSNTYGDWGQNFPSTQLQILNPAKTFGYSIVSSAITADRNVTLPLITVDDTFVFATFAQTLQNKTLSGAAFAGTISGTPTISGSWNWIAAQSFPTDLLQIFNPAKTFSYDFDTSAITADRNVTLPLLTANDTFAFIGFAQTFSALQTFNAGISVDATTGIKMGRLTMVAKSMFGTVEWVYQPNTGVSALLDLVPTQAVNTNAIGGGLRIWATNDTTNYDQLSMYYAGTAGYYIGSGNAGTATAKAINFGIRGANDLTINSDGTLGLQTAATFNSTALFNNPVTLAATYEDIQEMAVPANPASGTRRVYVDSTTHDVTALHSDGTKVDMESGAPPLPSLLGTRWGTFQGAGGSTPSGEGLLTNLSLTPSSNSGTAVFINNRPAEQFSSGASANHYCGFRTNNKIVTLSLSPTITCKVTIGASSSNNRIKFGFADSTSLTDGFATTLANINGIMIGYGVNDTNYSVITNNGGATQTNNTAGMPAINTAGNPTIFKLVWKDSTSTLTWSIQTAAGTTTTGTISTGNLPTNTTQMYLFCTGQQNNSGSAELFSVEDCEITFDTGSDFKAF